MIKYPQKFKQATPAGFNGIFDWDFLKPVFKGTNIDLMDIDAVVEKNGRILLFETKDPDKEIPLGQQITLKTLVIIGQGKIHLMVLYGKTASNIVAVDEWYYKNGKCETKGRMDSNADHIFQRVADWFQWAKNSGPF